MLDAYIRSRGRRGSGLIDVESFRFSRGVTPDLGETGLVQTRPRTICPRSHRRATETAFAESTRRPGCKCKRSSHPITKETLLERANYRKRRTLGETKVVTIATKTCRSPPAESGSGRVAKQQCTRAVTPSGPKCETTSRSRADRPERFGCSKNCRLCSSKVQAVHSKLLNRKEKNVPNAVTPNPSRRPDEIAYFQGLMI